MIDLLFRSPFFGEMTWWEADLPWMKGYTVWAFAHKRHGAELRHATMLEF